MGADDARRIGIALRHRPQLALCGVVQKSPIMGFGSTVFSGSRRRWVFGLALAATASVFAFARTAPPASAGELSSTPPTARVDLAVIATPRDVHASSSDVRFLTIDRRGVTEVFSAPVPHAVYGVVRGDVLRGRRAVAVVADVQGAPKGDYGSALYVVDETRGLRELARGVYHASRPLASEDGKIYVETGRAGAEPTRFDPSHLREDAVAIDAVDPDTGAKRSLYTWTGYTAHLAGEHGGELVVYRVGPGGADLVAIDRATGKSRLVASIPPFARDFSVDHARGALLFSNRDDVDTHLWTIESVDLSTGARTRRASSRDVSQVPFAMGADRSFVASPGQGLSLRTGPSASDRWLTPLGAGTDVVDAASSDGAWILFTHRGASGIEEAALHLGSNAVVRLSTRPENLRAIGFFGATDGGRR